MDVVGLYLRASKDRAGRMETVGDQEVTGREYVARTWPAAEVRVWVDNAISAFDEDAHRPGFEAMREAIRRGEITHLWAIEQTRLERLEQRWFEFAADLDAAGITEVHTGRDGVVRLDEVAGIKAVLAAAEVRRLRARVRDKHDRLAAQGRPAGGRQLGYTHGRNDIGESTLVIVEDEADAIRWAADAVLAGWSLSSVAAEWNARGLAQPRGGTKGWATNTVRQALTKPSVAGFRAHDRQITARATWEPILDETTWRRVVAALAQRSSARSSNGTSHPVIHHKRAARRYLLTGGIARCGLCEAHLVGQQRSWRGRAAIPYYHCHPSKGGCSRIGAAGEQLEAHVAGALLDELDRRAAFRDALAVDVWEARRSELTNRLAEIDSQHVDLARRWAAHQLPAAAWDAARGDLDDEAARLSAELAAVPAAEEEIDPAAVRASWGVLTLDERRHFVGLYIDTVWVDPARPMPRFDTERVRIDWRKR